MKDSKRKTNLFIGCKGTNKRAKYKIYSLISGKILQRFRDTQTYTENRKQLTIACDSLIVSDPVGIQTQDLQNRNLTLYSAKLRDQWLFILFQKIHYRHQKGDNSSHGSTYSTYVRYGLSRRRGLRRNDNLATWFYRGRLCFGDSTILIKNVRTRLLSATAKAS